MVGLVQRDPRVRLLELVANLGAVLVAAGDHDRLGPLDREKHTLDRETALVVDGRLLAPLDDLGVHDRDGFVLRPLEDEQPLKHAHLRRREADPVRIDHEHLHPLDEPAEVVVELLHRPRLHPQRGVGVLADLGEREPAPRLAFRVELVVLDLAFDLRHRAEGTLAAVTIRPVRPEDAEELAALYAANREFLAPYEPVRPDDFFTGDGQRERLERQVADGTHPFAIVDGGTIAGTINVFHIVRESLQSCTIGYWIDQTRNGRGLATGAVEDAVAYAFGELELHRVEAATLLDNVASQRVLEKAGFDRIGVARRFLLINGEWRDFVLFQRVAD